MTTGRFLLPRCVVAGVLSAFASVAQAQPVAPAVGGEIAQLRGDLYVAHVANQYTVFLVTSDGILLGDPISSAFALWLNEQFAARFPDRRVRYVVLSHHHFDRSEGGSVFNSATRVAHQRFNDEVDRARRTLPPFVDAADANRNGQFDPDELNRSADAPLLLSRDRDRDGTVTRDELCAYVPWATDRFAARRTITLGGRRVEIIHTGEWHSPDMSVLYFPEQRVVFAVDPPPVTTVPFSFGTSRAGDVYVWLREIVSLDFDVLVTGDGRTIPREQIELLNDYLTTLRADVIEQYERRRTLAQMQAAAIPEAYRGDPQYAGRVEQIGALFGTLRFRTADLSVSGVMNYASRDKTYCSTRYIAFASCTGGGIAPAGTVAVSYMFSRTVGVVLEMLLSEQTWNTRNSPRYGEEFALRQSRGAAVVRYVPFEGLAIVVGPSMTYGDARGVTIQRGVNGVRRQVHTTESVSGMTAGVDLKVPLRAGITLFLPIRANVLTGTRPVVWPGKVAATAGLGVTLRLSRTTD